MSTKRKILVTAALPYANGPIHIGHLVEYIQADIWTRFQKGLGHDAIYLCADDAHGTPIMLRAREEKTTPQALIDEMKKAHEKDFRDFNVNFDLFHSTHSEENKALCESMYKSLDEKGLISTRDVEQAYDEKEGMFLPDRYVKGTCPKCNAKDQYGDSCDACGTTYAPSELIDAVSVISGTKPILKPSSHYFFSLGDCEKILKTWLKKPNLQKEVVNKLNEWVEGEDKLRDWDISRDAPYWGFEIPNAKGKFFYVWFDAPIGYLAATQKHCADQGLSFDDYWSNDADSEVYHFIGKDIAYFHMLFWPARLHHAGYRMPSGVFCHGFLTVDGQKMSKSKGTFIMAKTYLDHLDSDYLRYYYAVKLNNGISDIDLNLEDFEQRVNSDLIGKLVNIASRNAGFIHKHFDGHLAKSLPNPTLFEDIAKAKEVITKHYDERHFSKAMKHIMQLADSVNKYIDEKKPWKLIKDESTLKEAHDVATQGLECFRQLISYLSPVVPALAQRSGLFLNTDLSWADIEKPLLGRKLEPFKPLLQRIDKKKIKAMVDASQSSTSPPSSKKAASTQPKASSSKHIAFKDFEKIDLRVAEVIEASSVDGADKLLQLTLKVGDDERNVFAGIKESYPDPSALVGKHVVCVANLAPKKMRFGTSEGMVLAAGPGGKEIFLVSPSEGAVSGMKVK